MKLWEAMLAGAKLIPQARGRSLFWMDADGNHVSRAIPPARLTHACPVGQAVVGRAGSKDAAMRVAFSPRGEGPSAFPCPLGVGNAAILAWPVLSKKLKEERLPCRCSLRPAAATSQGSADYQRSLLMAIAHLNDAERWETERIAAWVRSVEAETEETSAGA